MFLWNFCTSSSLSVKPFTVPSSRMTLWPCHTQHTQCMSHTTHSVPVTHNTLCACHTQHTQCLSHTTHCLSHTTHSAPVTRNRLRVSARNVASLHAPVHIYSHTHPSPNTHTLPVVACTTNLHYSSGRLYSYTCPNLHYSSGRLQGSTCRSLHYSSGRLHSYTRPNLPCSQSHGLQLHPSKPAL